MSERKITAQIATSIEADFGERTWTFKLGSDMLVSAGVFYIVPKDEYERLSAASEQGEKK